VKDDDAYARASEAQVMEMEKLRVGVRQGMMPWGRERNGRVCYQTAVTEMAKEHPIAARALWHLDCAINLPQFLEAINRQGTDHTATDQHERQQHIRRCHQAGCGG